MHLVFWYLLFTGTGIIFWITFSKYFSKLADRGYAISKVMLLGASSLLVWLFGFVFHMQTTALNCAVVLGLLCAACLGLKFKFKIKLPNVAKKEIIITEIVFLLLLFVSLLITSLHPTIDNVTERIMDFKLLNVLTLTNQLPAPDVWFSPNTVNYYYYGHFFFGMIDKLTGTNAFMGYLFSMGFIYALFGVMIFSLARSVKKNYLFAGGAVLFAMFFSNFSFIYNIVEKFFLTTNSDETTKFFILCIDFIFIISIILSLSFIRRKENRIFLLVTLPIILGHLWFTKSFDTLFAFKDFLLDPSKSNLWFPDVSRVIESTINEFPYYSIIIGDMHPHFVDLIFLPVIMTFLFLDFVLLKPRKILLHLNKYINPVFKKQNWKSRLHSVVNIFKSSYIKKIAVLKIFELIIFSIAIVTNSWDLICIGVFIGIKDLVFIYQALNSTVRDNKIQYWKAVKISGFVIFLDAFVYAGSFIIQLPYLKSIQSPVKGIKLNLINNATDFYSFFREKFDFLAIFKFDNFGLERLIILGLFIYFIYIFTQYLIKKSMPKKIYAIVISCLTLLTILVSALLSTLINYVQNNFDISPLSQYLKVWLIFYLISIVACIFLYLDAKAKNFKKEDFFVLVSIITGVTLSIFTEFFYVADYFDRAGYQHHRANTVFKVNYIGFVFFAIAAIWVLFRLVKAFKWQKTHAQDIKTYSFSLILSFTRTFLFISIFLIFLYAPYAFNQWYAYFPADIRLSLDGYGKTKQKYPDMIEATDYFNTIKQKGDVILESNGDGYKYHDIASVYTATPTVLGWWGHEAQWRETSDPKIIDDLLAGRVAEVAKVYNLTEGWQSVITKYNIKYVWVTDAEREKQNQNVTNIFDSQPCFSKTFENKTVKIFKVIEACVEGKSFISKPS